MVNNRNAGFLVISKKRLLQVLLLLQNILSGFNLENKYQLYARERSRLL